MIHGTNKKVDGLNEVELQKLPGIEAERLSEDSTTLLSSVEPGDVKATLRELKGDSFFSQCSAPVKLRLRVGAQVMVVKNLSETLVNGSRGVVTVFADVPIIKSVKKGHFKDKEQQQVLVDDVAIELFGKSSWQDVTFDDVGTANNGQTWTVACKRKFPVVEFLDGETKVITLELFDQEISGKGTCLRLQVPLRLAWALTVHKLQGMELDFCVFDLSSIFGYGMGYSFLLRERGVVKWMRSG
eukprot:CAMPEP_0113477736 /NCGR_PEP_ID=MMETSP0014_2-20120614/20364_1 /TAXON_ID=2857 /ORGANISM="Nitzschia sp." /LENGTH=241 /DNA_ID=CAMNT_0000370845 /DNA_START=540 /DNA_END=1265 /DNA_ORIENTATION=+ /assembly_acc=CAM_ASM_000159